MRCKWFPAVAGFLDKLDTRPRAVFYLECNVKLDCSVTEIFVAVSVPSVRCVK